MNAIQPSEIYPVLDEAGAREITDLIRRTGDIIWSQFIRAYFGRAWEALGYTSWDEYTDAELGARIQMPRGERSSVVGEMRSAGMSLRAIASALKVDAKTIRNDLTGGEFSPPVEAVGVDGKSYPAKVTTTTRSTEAVTVEQDIDLATGEILTTRPARPATPALTPEEQAAAEMEAEYARRARLVEQAISHWPHLYGLRTSGFRDHIIDRLCESDREQLALIESRIK